MNQILTNIRPADRLSLVSEHYFSLKLKEIARRNAFKQAAIATRERLVDPDQSLMDQIAFTQQTKYKTIYAYVFNQCYKATE